MLFVKINWSMPLSNRKKHHGLVKGSRQTDNSYYASLSTDNRVASLSSATYHNNGIHPQARISLVGAGPGDPELITLKAIRTLESADVILYDSLANPALLEYNPTAKHIFVGKRKGWQRYSQDEINALLLTLARQPWHIIRLKGGDPMVFGRAMEEINAVKQYGIPVNVVPGISAYSGMAAQQQIPITERGISKSFWVVTGTNKDGEVTADMQLAAQSSATVIVYMGMSQLERIVDLFAQHKASDYPVSIIQNASLPDARTLSGQLDNIVALQTIAQLGSPGLIVLGPAARHIRSVETHLTHKAIVNFD
jgi:uroporphyrin-III C-methyltransferase